MSELNYVQTLSTVVLFANNKFLQGHLLPIVNFAKQRTVRLANFKVPWSVIALVY